MAETAAHLVDCVIPRVPVRQWVSPRRRIVSVIGIPRLIAQKSGTKKRLIAKLDAHLLVWEPEMPEPQDLIREACAAIGAGDADTDWKIVPTEHATQFEDKAPSLAHNLRAARVLGLATIYERLNASAVAAQDSFKNTVGKANTAIFLTASLAALLLVAAGLQAILGTAGPWVAKGIGVLGIVFAGLGAMWLSQVKDGNLARAWVNERAKAEAKRLAYFKAIMEGASANPLDQLLAFEYTRRFLVDNQIDYFRGRGQQHERAADNALKLSTNSVFAASASTALAGAFSMAQPQLALIAGLGVVASAYAALATSRSAVSLDRKNADRYRDGADKLEERKLDIDTFRERAAVGDKSAVQEFFEPIFVTLEADHKEFLSIAEQRELAIGAMGTRLDAAKEALEKKRTG